MVGCDLLLPLLVPGRDQVPEPGVCAMIPNSSVLGEVPCLEEGYGLTRVVLAKEVVELERHEVEGTKVAADGGRERESAEEDNGYGCSDCSSLMRA